MTPSLPFNSANSEEKEEALNYLDSVIGEIAGRRRALAETETEVKQESLF